MMTRYRLALIALVALAAGPRPARADVLTLNFPGASSTVAWGIDGSNIVGR